MITKQASALLIPITALTHKKVVENLSEKDLADLRRKFRKGTRSNIKMHILSKIFKGSKKFGRLGEQVAEDLGNKKVLRLTLPPLSELLGAYLMAKKFKKTAGILASVGQSVKQVPSNLGKDFVHPMNLYNSVQGVASGQDSVGSAVGRFAGSTVGAMGLSKLMAPLINVLPGPLKAVARVGSFVGSMYAGSKVGDIGARMGSKVPIFKRKGYNTIQDYNENGAFNS